MRLWQMTALTLGVTALLFTGQPARAQVWVGVNPVVVAPAWQVGPAWPVARATYVGPVWGARRYWRSYRRAGWYGAVRAPRGRVVVAGRRW
jgi:hypothetical protein